MGTTRSIKCRIGWHRWQSAGPNDISGDTCVGCARRHVRTSQRVLDGESGYTGSGPDGWGDAADLEHGAGRNRGGRGAFSVPSELVEKPTVRLVWFWGWFALGVGAFVGMILFTVNSQEADPVRDLSIGVAIALAFGVYGARGLRWGIVADENGIQLTNTFRRHTIAWSDLDDIQLEEISAEVSIGFHRLVFVTRQKGRIAADAPTGLAEPGRKMFELWQSLSAMWQRLRRGRPRIGDSGAHRARGPAGGFVGGPIDSVCQKSLDAERVGRLPHAGRLAGRTSRGWPSIQRMPSLRGTSSTGRQPATSRNLPTAICRRAAMRLIAGPGGRSFPGPQRWPPPLLR